MLTASALQLFMLMRPFLVLAPAPAAVAQPAGAATVLDEDADPQSAGAPASSKPSWNGLTEVKREYTDKGQPPEKTQSTVKIDWYYRRYGLSLLRLQVPFPDQNQEDAELFHFFHPRPGDMKARVGFQSFPVAAVRVGTFVELTFPTASPEDLGQGKYQVNVGARGSTGLSRSRKIRLDVQISETASVAGDPETNEINKSNGEVTVRKSWSDDTYVQASLKPVVNWEKAGLTGATAEVKANVNITRRWNAWVMYGHLAWGLSAPGMYENKVGFGFRRAIGRGGIPIAGEE